MDSGIPKAPVSRPPETRETIREAAGVEVIKDSRLSPCVLAAVLAFALWLIVGQAVFALRHPWATETQRFLHTFDALFFRAVEPPEVK